MRAHELAGSSRARDEHEQQLPTKAQQECSFRSELDHISHPKEMRRCRGCRQARAKRRAELKPQLTAPVLGGLDEDNLQKILREKKRKFFQAIKGINRESNIAQMYFMLLLPNPMLHNDKELLHTFASVLASADSNAIPT